MHGAFATTQVKPYPLNSSDNNSQGLQMLVEAYGIFSLCALASTSQMTETALSSLALFRSSQLHLVKILLRWALLVAQCSMRIMAMISE